MHKLLASFALLVGLAGCSAPLSPITAPPYAVTFTDASARNGIASLDFVQVRTLLRTNGETAELRGARCEIRGRGYTASIQTPAIVQLPLYLGRTANAQISCLYDGQTITRTLRAINLTQESLRTSDPFDRPTGLFIKLSIRANHRDRFDYENTSLTFRR